MIKIKKYKGPKVIISEILAELSGWLLSVLMLILIIDFIARGLYKPIQGITEIAIFILVAVVYLDQARCMEQKSTVRVTIFFRKIQPNLQKLANLLDYFITLLTFGIVIYAVLENALYAYRTKESLASTVTFYLYPVKFVIVVGFIFAWIYTLINIREEFHELGKRKY